jgi:hypothetical protein
MQIWSRLISAFVLCGMLAVGTAPTASGQEFGRLEDVKSTVAYFYHAEPGDATVQVSVWGSISRPGVYEVPVETGLDLLLTMAGGAPIGERQEGRRPTQVTVRVYRPVEGDERTLLFESNLDDMLTGQVSYPTFLDNDVIVVEAIQPRKRFTWRDAISVLSSVGTLTLLALRIFDRR